MNLAARMGSLPLAISALALAGCVSTYFRPAPDFKVRQGPPVSPDSVQVLRSAPSQPYVKLGEIEAWVSGFPSNETARRRAREAAAAVGADAIYLQVGTLFADEPRTGDGPISVGTRVVAFTVTAIRYEGPPQH